MTRHVLIRDENQPGNVAAEAELPTEAELHDALTRYPELIPHSDLGIGAGVVIGRESVLAAGYTDLVLIDEMDSSASGRSRASAILMLATFTIVYLSSVMVRRSAAT